MLLTEFVNQQTQRCSFVDSAQRTAEAYAAQLGKGIPAVYCSNKVYNNNFELTNKSMGVRGAVPVVITDYTLDNYVGTNKPNEFGFVTDHSYKYKVNGVKYGPDGFQKISWITDDIENLKNLI